MNGSHGRTSMRFKWAYSSGPNACDWRKAKVWNPQGSVSVSDQGCEIIYAVALSWRASSWFEHVAGVTG
jgi:hypothetical protein